MPAISNLERKRILRFMAKRDVHIELPCRNEELPRMIDDGYAEIIRTYVSKWGPERKEHTVTVIRITDKGWAELEIPTNT